jgi:hypothetical protein
LPPISWIIYTHNHYGALDNPRILSPPQNTRVHQHVSDNDRRQAVVTPLPRSAPELHVMTSGRKNEDSALDSSQVPRTPRTTISQPAAGPKKVRWALGSTGTHTNNNHPQRSILRAGSSKNVMTVPFTVSFRLNGKEYTVEFEPVNGSNFKLGNFERQLAKAVPDGLKPHLRSTLKIGYKLFVQRLMRTATALIEGMDEEVREASFSVAHESRTRNEKLDGFEFFTLEFHNFFASLSSSAFVWNRVA